MRILRLFIQRTSQSYMNFASIHEEIASIDAYLSADSISSFFPKQLLASAIHWVCLLAVDINP